MIRVTLPYPPTGNHAVKHTRAGRHYLTAEAQAYRKQVWIRIKQAGLRNPFLEPVRVRCEITFPDNRRRDMDNVAKSLLDALTYAGVWRDDYQIHDLRLVRLPAEKPGCVLVTIEPMYPTTNERRAA